MKYTMRLILDLDETLLDTLERQYFLLNELLAKYAYSVEKRTYLVLKEQKLSNIEILLHCGIKPKIIDKIHSQYIGLIESQNFLQLDSLLVNYGLLLCLSETHDLHLCSQRSDPKNSMEQLKRLNIISLFKSITWVSHSEIKGKVPAVKKIQETYGKIDFYIGDSDIDKIAADANKISFKQCSRYNNKIHTEKLINKIIYEKI